MVSFRQLPGWDSENTTNNVVVVVFWLGFSLVALGMLALVGFGLYFLTLAQYSEASNLATFASGIATVILVFVTGWQIRENRRLSALEFNRARRERERVAYNMIKSQIDKTLDQLRWLESEGTLIDDALLDEDTVDLTQHPTRKQLIDEYLKDLERQVDELHATNEIRIIAHEVQRDWGRYDKRLSKKSEVRIKLEQLNELVQSEISALSAEE